MAARQNRNNLPRVRPSSEVSRQSSSRALAARITVVLHRHPRRALAAAIVAATCIVAICAYTLWPPAAAPAYRPTARAKAYAQYTACLLTDEAGITAQTAKPVWAGMQAASAKSAEQVSYLTMAGPDTAASAETYVNTLALRGCNLILATGNLPDQAVDVRAAAYPALEFITTPMSVAAATSTASAEHNVTAIPAGKASDVQAAVESALIQDYHSAS